MSPKANLVNRFRTSVRRALIDRGRDPESPDDRRWLAHGARVSPIALGQLLGQHNPGSLTNWAKLLEFLEIDVEISTENYENSPQPGPEEVSCRLEVNTDHYVSLTKYRQDRSADAITMAKMQGQINALLRHSHTTTTRFDSIVVGHPAIPSAEGQVH